MRSHSLPSCIGSVESCAPSPLVTISIAPFCESIFTPATLSPAATTALTARVTSRCRKLEGARAITAPSDRRGYRRWDRARGDSDQGTQVGPAKGHPPGRPAQAPLTALVANRDCLAETALIAETPRGDTFAQFPQFRQWGSSVGNSLASGGGACRP